MPRRSLFWHDYETWGANPRWDRPSQFAGIRTDLELNIIDEPVNILCRPPKDRLPEPMAAIITGISPFKAEAEGVCEAEFFQRIHQELAMPGTCGLGYNSIRFDDEVTRFGLYRNFYPPYDREWRNDCSRWDIIDMLRLVRALRPEGMEWPLREDGCTSFRLEDLTQANDIVHEGAHDALADVQATIALARLVRKRQPRLYDYVFNNRDKAAAARMLDLRTPRMLLHVSRMFGAERGSMAVIVPLLADARNKNAIHCYDLTQDPGPWIGLAADEIHSLLYSSKEALAASGKTRPALKTVHLNKCPVLAPINTLTDAAKAQWQIDLAACERNMAQLQAFPGLIDKLQQLYASPFPEDTHDPEQALYQGFIGDADRKLCDQVLRMDPQALASARIPFKDARLPELLFSYRARNWPESLDTEENQRWQLVRHTHLHQGPLTAASYFAQIAELREQYPEQQGLLQDLENWAAALGLEKS